jgi:hypothetical protein
LLEARLRFKCSNGQPASKPYDDQQQQDASQLRLTPAQKLP